MSIPLDRLYHFLEDVINEDIIIYRWFPHGSRKLDDLKLLKSYNHLDKLDIKWMAKTPIMICHDQEPLFFHLYSQKELMDSFIKWVPDGYKGLAMDHPMIMSYVQHMNIRAALIPSGLDRDLLLHSEQRSRQLELYEQHGLIGVYYWSHALISRDWFRYAEHDHKLINHHHSYHYDFLVLNRSWSGSREYRLKLAELIVDNDLRSACHMKFNPQEQDRDYRDHVFVNSALQITRQDLRQHLPANPAPSSASADYSTDDYLNCGIEVVLETLFDDDRLHLTEKSLRPIACAKPFILAATTGSLDYLRSYGFKTFHPYIDESYDQECNPVKRLNMIANEMSRIKNMNQLAKQNLWAACGTISRENQKYFFSDAFHNRVIDEFRSNYHRAIQTCRVHDQNKDLRQWLNLQQKLLGENILKNWSEQFLKFLDGVS